MDATLNNINAAELGLRLKGRAKRALTAVLGDELKLGDLERLQTERSTQAPPIKKLRERHHALARSIASGINESEAGILCGYSGSRVSILKADKAFSELIEFYRERVNDEYLGMHERMAGLGIDAVEELTERLETATDSFSNGQLLDIAGKMADRTGHGPSIKQEINVKVGLADRLASARKRINESLPLNLIDVTPEVNT